MKSSDDRSKESTEKNERDDSNIKGIELDNCEMGSESVVIPHK